MSAISCQQRQFGTLATGQTVTCYSLRNTSGMTVSLLNYGAILNAVQIPDFRGEMHKITLGPSQLDDLQTNHCLSGSTMAHIPARYGITFNALHQTLWEAESNTHDETANIKLVHAGMIDLPYSMTKLEYRFTTEYTLTVTNELIIRSQIHTSIPLPVFLTHHPIWNLTGVEEGDISDHVLQVWASHYSMMDQRGLTHSEYLDIHDQPAFNFQQPQRIGEKRAQVPPESTYDACFRLAEQEDTSVSSSLIPLAARVKAPVSGRTLEVYTTQTGLRFYLESSAQNRLKGFCLTPMPFLSASSQPTANEPIMQQETRYKLIW
jgi:aldose 1-epimerase